MRMLTCVLTMLVLATTSLPAPAETGKIYRVVDEDGNVTYTDQAPEDGAEPMDLPELSIIQMETPEVKAPRAEGGEGEPGPRELRRMYRDFGIRTPQDEETFWGTANQVTVSWGSEQPLMEGMTVRLYVDGEPRDVTGSSSTTLTLDRGTHTVRVDLFRGGNRPIVSSSTVTFFVKQASVGFRSRMSQPEGR